MMLELKIYPGQRKWGDVTIGRGVTVGGKVDRSGQEARLWWPLSRIRGRWLVIGGEGDMGEVIGYEPPEGIDGNTLTFETPWTLLHLINWLMGKLIDWSVGIIEQHCPPRKSFTAFWQSLNSSRDFELSSSWKKNHDPHMTMMINHDPHMMMMMMDPHMMIMMMMDPHMMIMMWKEDFLLLVRNRPERPVSGRREGSR